MSPRVRIIPAALLALALALALVRPASAHATIVRSFPAAGAALDTAPPSIVLEFSEALDPNFSRAQLFDSANQLVEPGPGQVDPQQPTVLRLTIPDLAKGSYTVIWRVRSAADGHITEGNLPFGVGMPAVAGALIPRAGAPDPATLPPPPLDTAARWLNYLAALVALGGPPFVLLVWRPAYRRVAAAEGADAQALERADVTMTAFLRRMALFGGIAFLATNLLFLLTQAASAADVPLAQALGAPVLGLLSGGRGLIWLARLALVAQVIVLARRLPLAGGGPPRLWWIMFVIGDVALLTLSLLSHAAASSQAPLAVPLDWLHLTAMVAWVGGLIPLAAAASAARRGPGGGLPLGPLAVQFTRLALPCVAVLALTGLYSSYLHVGQIELLPATTYGRALLIKLGLFVALVLLGALNMQVLTRRLRGAPGQGARGLARSVRAEIVIGALVLLAVGAMTSVAPSLTAWEAHEQQGIAQSATVGGDVDLTLRIAPAQIGDNEFAVDVTDRRPGAAAAPTRVLLRFDMLGMQMTPLQTDAAAAGGERYTARGSFTSMGGRWHIEVVLRRAGFDDVRHTFEVDILRGQPFVITQ